MGSGPGKTRRIEWTGERCVPWTDDIQVVYEHYHRYAYALSYARGKRVLDLACGEGYGCALLAAAGAEVVGLDIDPDTVAHARENYPEARFELGSITDPSALAGEAPFDVVTCFEAIEHVEDHAALMNLVRARLAPGGVFLCSTPDVDVYAHAHGNQNPYHVRELTSGQFRDTLAARFEHVVMLRQTVAVGSLIHGAPNTALTVATVRQRPDSGWDVAEGAPHTYLFAIASDAPVSADGAAVLTDPDLTLVKYALDEVAGARGELQRLEQSARQREDAFAATVRDRDAELAEVRAQVDHLRERLAQADKDAAATAHDLEVAMASIDRVVGDHEEDKRRLEHLDQELRRSASEVQRLRKKAERDAARLTWLAESKADLDQTVRHLSAENASLRAEASSAAHQLISRYRATVERVAPRGSRRRGTYERAMGRSPVPPGSSDTVPGPVAVSTSAEPVVTVVIPTYGKWEFTRRCLQSIEEHLPSTPFEVVVVDDASPDGSAELVAACPGVRLVANPRNTGFVGACNLGARHARGELLMFLNNDTEVRSGWLDAAVDVLDANPDVGLVGAKLIFPDGRLQECGGIVWRDGSGWNYGRLDDPGQPEYRTVRDVDYCSGAAITVRRELFERIGGFDERFAPAYYEDTDLAFAVRAAGLRTVVQPEAVVVHHEGVSHGTDVSSGVKRFQEINRATFVDKWADALEHHLPEASPRNVWLGRQRTARGHTGGVVLVADHQIPRTDEDSGSLRMFRVLEQLVSLGHRVIFFPMNHAWPERYVRMLSQAGVTVVPDAGRQQEFLRHVGPDLRFALLSRPDVAWRLMESLRAHAPDCVIAYDTVDLHFLRLQRQADLADSLGSAEEASVLRRRASVLRELELGMTRAADLTFTVSDVEAEILGKEIPEATVRVLSNIHRLDAVPASPDGRSGVLFVGGFDHQPNRDAARWLVEEIMPLVWDRQPDVVAHIVGSNPPPEVLELGSDRVVVHGWVADLDAVYRRVRLTAAPLRFGAGVKGKVGESLCLGVPVVGTQIAAEGMHLSHGRDVLIADTAEGLADQMVALLQDDELWHGLSVAGRRAVSVLFGPERARETLSEVVPLGLSE